MPEVYVAIASRTAASLGLPRFLAHPRAARDKYAMRRRLAAFTRCPEWRLIRSADDISSMTGMTFPCVLKPRHGYGSMCVMKINDATELVRTYAQLHAALAIMSQDNPLAIPSSDMLVESFLEGTEHTVELFLSASQPVIEIVSDKGSMAPPYFVETGDVMPSCLAPEERDLVLEAARCAARAIGVEHGWTHVEIKLHDQAATVVEIAARNGGGYTRDMVKLAYRLDMRRVLIDSHLGTRPTQPSVEMNTVIGQNMVAYGLTLAFTTNGLTACKREACFREVNQRLPRWVPRLFAGPPYSYDNTIMSYFVFHPNGEQALALFQKMKASIKVHRFSAWIKSTFAYSIFLIVLRLRHRRQPRSRSRAREGLA